MKYIFFDIESANGISRICEFGYSIWIPENNLIYKWTYLINPKAKFKLIGRKHRRDVCLSFAEEKYKDAPSFKEVYNDIKSLLEQEDATILGWSVENDIKFLDKECSHYKLPKIKYIAYDVQAVYKQFKNNKYLSLEYAANELIKPEDNNDLIDHRSSDDAYKTMLVFQQIIKELNITENEMISICEPYKYDSIAFINQEKRRQEEKLIIQKNRKLYLSKCTDLSLDEIHDNSINKYYVTSKIITNTELLNKIIDKKNKENIILVSRIKDANYVIVIDEKEKEAITSSFKQNINFQIILLNDFLK